MTRIVTDGACRGNPGPGGWAALIRRDGQTETIGGHEPHTTNNRMEMRAAIEALRRVPPDEPVCLITDSEYLLKGITTWIHGWKRHGWKTSTGEDVLNRDLWEELDRLAGGRVTWQKVRGHAGDPENEQVDALAQAYTHGPHPAAAHLPSPQPGTGPARRPHSGVTYLSLVGGVLQRHAAWEECRARVYGARGARFKKCRCPEEEEAIVRAWGLDPELLRCRGG